ILARPPLAWVPRGRSQLPAGGARGGTVGGSRKRPSPLGERLVGAGVISEAELEAALKNHANSNVQLGETLLKMGLVDEDTLILFLGQQIGVPAVRLRSGLIDPQAVRLLPRAKAEAYCALALFRVRD
ncbi:MAG: hypothetical protein ACK53L_09905, partial [Pirellulaceae bacterium]